MGYSTEFTGQFTFDQEPSIGVIRQLNTLADTDTRDLDDGLKYPGRHCQWEPTPALDGLKWDGNEKFNDYVEWLQWIIDKVLKPAKLTIRGRVRFQGDECTDRGFLVVEDDQHVRIEKLKVVGDSLEELTEFRDWVLSSRECGSLVTSEWLRHKE